MNVRYTIEVLYKDLDGNYEWMPSLDNSNTFEDKYDAIKAAIECYQNSYLKYRVVKVFYKQISEPIFTIED